jgi:DNA-binding CsgD family transcriptional regulator
MSHDLLEVIESAYRLDAPPAEWLREVGTAIYRQLGGGLGLLAFHYQITADDRLLAGAPVSVETAFEMPADSNQSLSFLPPSFVRKTFMRCECASQSESLDDEMRTQMGPMLDAMQSTFGMRDIVMVGGVDPTRHGVYFGAWSAALRRLDPAVRATWSRVAVHLVAANRLRRRLGAGEPPDSADAVLTPGGAVDHARGEAEVRAARDALREAVRGLERARGGLRRRDPAGAVETWKGLVSTRWSLVDHFSSDGKRYVLARRNDVRIGGLEALTDRERQALAWAALGHGNKLIAYEMGISSSTVGVLLHRAAQKLGARGRADLIARFTRRP